MSAQRKAVGPGLVALLSAVLFLALLAGPSVRFSTAQELGPPQDAPLPHSLPPASLAAYAIISWEHDQLRPAVAYSTQANRYLVVWEDHHWGWGDDWDIIARFVGADGVPLGSVIGISYDGSNHRLAPAVAYNAASGEFLVVCEYEYSPDDHDIYARRVGADGTPIGGEFVVSNLTNWESSPAVAYSTARNEYLVVWEHLFEGLRHGIYGRRVAANGELLGEPIAIDTSSMFALALVPYDALAPAVAYGSAYGQYLVVWQDKAPEKTDYDITGRRVGDDGSLLGDEIAISTWENDQVRPRLAFNSAANEFMVVWEDHHWGWGDDWDIYAQRVNANGTLVGGNLGISWDGANHRQNPAVAYKAAANEYLVAWEFEYTTTDHDVYRRRVASNGTLTDSEVVISNLAAWEGQPALAADARDAYLIVWEDGRDAATNGMDLWADLVRLPAATATPTPTPTATRTRTPTTRPTPTRTATPTHTVTRTATPTASPTRTRTSAPTATRTATPTATRTVAVTPTATPTLTEGPLPDLVITDIWNEDRQICYQVMNIGYALASRGHETALFVDGAYRASHPVELDLEPAARWKGCFDYLWECTARQDDIVVETDYTATIPEDDETNNRRGEDWKCDASPPEIVDGPRALEITHHSALISWQTDENSDSLVQYGQTARLYAFEAADPALLTRHTVPLTGLEPSTTYHFRVQSADSSGNAVASRDGVFQTLPLADDLDPIVSLLDPGICRGTVTIRATASDNTGVERVEFYLNAVSALAEPSTPQALLPAHASAITLTGRVFTDYSSPFEFDVDTAKFANGQYSVVAKAVDHSGRSAVDDLVVDIENLLDLAGPTVNLYHPSEGATVSGDQRILVEITDDTGVSKIEFFVNTTQLSSYNYPTTPSSVHFSVSSPYWWNTEFFANGPYTVTVIATDEHGKIGVGAVHVKVANPTSPLRPKLVVTKHQVTRHANYFGIDLTIANQGGAVATNIVIEDSLKAFQPVAGWDASHLVHYASEWNPATYEGICIISDTMSLGAGQSRYYTVKAVPVMVHPNPPTPSIGDSVEFSYRGPYGTTYSESVSFTILKTTLNYPDVSIPTAHSDALKQANYLLVTNPTRIYGGLLLALLFGADVGAAWDDANDLLASMAHLAYLKNGVLGYTHTYDAPTLRNLIVSGGAWAKKLSPAFSTSLGGYLLLVGETEIIPYWYYPQPGTGPIHHSDQPYSDTSGNDDWPDLIVGRIIGNTYKDLAKAIKTSIGIQEGTAGYGFDHSHALVIAGGCGGENAWQDDLDNKVAILDDQFAVSKIQCLDYYHLSSFNAAFAQDDCLAAGHVTGNAKAEVIIGDASADQIHVYAANGTKLNSFDCGYGAKDFAAGDRLAVANGMIVMADSSANRILYYNSAGTLQSSFSLTFDAGDGLATGDVLGDSVEDIVIADASTDKVYVFKVDGAKLGEFSCTYGPQDALAVGAVLASGKAQVLRANANSSFVHVYGSSGTQQASFDTDYSAGDGLGVGDVFGDAIAEVLIADGQTGRIHIYSYWVDPEGKKPSAFRQNVHYQGSFASQGGFAVGDSVGGAKSEVLVARHVSGAVNLSEPVCASKLVSPFKSQSTNKDVIFFTGHGSPSGWCDVIGTGDLPASFGNTNPLVFGATCSSGNYDGNNDESIGEAFFDRGASIYLGATIPSYDGWESDQFFKNWVNTTKSVGRAFAQTEKDAIAKIKDYYWVREYNLYGDPKVGGSASSSAVPAPATLGSGQDPPAFLEVVVPDFQVATTNGYDHVEIPAGALLLVEGQPRVPLYTASLDYPPGYSIQDVVLVHRSGLSVTTGLNIPPVELPVRNGAEGSATSANGWYPEADYEWQAYQNPDGSTTLVITLYPFYYNPLTTDVQFYQIYAFDIAYTASAVEVTALQTDAGVYPQGAPVLVDLILHNAGEPLDVIVNAVVKRSSSHEVIAGLLLRTLRGLTGPASFSLHWDSAGFEPDYYYLEATLQAEGAGSVLDSETAMFTLGIASAEITDFSATPAHFAPGDAITISLALGNTGTVPISGTARIRVQDEMGETIQEFSHEIADLVPANLVHLDDVWYTTVAHEGTYIIVGEFLYESMAADPCVAVVSTSLPLAHIYLPVITKNQP